MAMINRKEGNTGFRVFRSQHYSCFMVKDQSPADRCQNLDRVVRSLEKREFTHRDSAEPGENHCQEGIPTDCNCGLQIPGCCWGSKNKVKVTERCSDRETRVKGTSGYFVFGHAAWSLGQPATIFTRSLRWALRWPLFPWAPNSDPLSQRAGEYQSCP